MLKKISKRFAVKKKLHDGVKKLYINIYMNEGL